MSAWTRLLLTSNKTSVVTSILSPSYSVFSRLRLKSFPLQQSIRSSSYLSRLKIKIQNMETDREQIKRPRKEETPVKQTKKKQEEEETEEEDDYLSSVHHPLSQISIRGPEGVSKSTTELLQQPLIACKDTTIGTLPNGLKYVITPNDTPPNRVQAHLEVHVGSKDELDDEQGIAHYLEHAVFLGTEKYPNAEMMRNVLAGWGMNFGGDANAFTDFDHTVYTFQAPLPESTEEKQKQVYNLLEVLYEITFKAHLLPEPIGIERGAVLSELVSSNTADYRVEYQKFQVVHGNNILSKRFPIGKEDQLKKFTAEDLRKFYKKHYRIDNVTLHICGSVDVEQTKDIITKLYSQLSAPTEPLPKRASVDRAPPTARIKVFQDELNTQFSFSVNSLDPIEPLTTLKQAQTEMILSVIELAFDARIYALEQEQANPPFTSIALEVFDSHRENARSTILSINSHPREWKEAMTVGLQELQQFYSFGITDEELKEHLGTLLKDAHSEAEQNDTQDSSELIEFIMDDVNIGNALLDRKSEYKYQMRIAPTITLAEVNAKVKELFSWVPNLTTRQLAEQPYTSMFVSAPVKYRKKPFKITEQEIISTYEAAIKTAAKPHGKAMPEELVDPKSIEQKEKKMQPKFIEPIDKRPNKSVDVGTTKIVDGDSGIQLMRLSNGITVQMKHTTFSAKQCTLRVNIRGGRSLESERSGELALGLTTFISGGAGNYSSDEINKYCNFHGINMNVGMGTEHMWFDFDFSVSHNGLRKALSILHLFLTGATFDQKAFQRAKKSYKIDCDRLEKEVEILSSDNLMKILFDPVDNRFVSPRREDYDLVTLEESKAAILRQMASHNMDICIIGDFDIASAEPLILSYLGTIPEQSSPFSASTRSPKLSFTRVPKSIQDSVEDDEPRAYLCLGGPSIARWEKPKNLYAITPKTTNSLYISRVFYVLTQVLSNKLFTIVREKYGLTYDISADISLTDWYERGIFSVMVTPFVDKIEETKQRTLEVLRQVKEKQITQAELDEVVIPLAKSVSTSLNTNPYWIGLMSNLQNPSIPRDLNSLVNIPDFYQSITLEDVFYVIDNYFDIDNLSTSICISTPTKAVE